MRLATLCTACLILFSTGALAAGPARSKEPLKIKSDQLHADNEKKSATFEGNVVARQGDLTLYADRVVISYNTGKDLDKVEAFGKVRLVQGDREAHAEHAVYETKTARVVLDGSPKVLQGKNHQISGRVITYYLDEQRSVVTGGPNERVEAVITPGEKDGALKR